MGRIVVTEFISLDGIIEDPGGAEGTANGGWSFRFPTPDGERFKADELAASDAQLLGRVTYEGFAAAWPAMEEAVGEFAVRMNNMPKAVVSTTITEATWKNTRIITGNVPAEVARLKDQHAGDILVAGSATLVDTLRKHDLVDEYRLLYFPVHLGSGKKLFRDGARAAALRLLSATTTNTGVIIATYEPAGPAQYGSYALDQE